MIVTGVILRRVRAESYPRSRTFLVALIPLFLIISSSVYPAIISTIENEEMVLIAEAVAQLKGKGIVDTSSHHADMQISSSDIISSSSPTSIAPPLSTTSAASIQSIITQIVEDKVEDLITATTINAGDPVHVLWYDDTPGPSTDILYKRDGADFDPTTMNLSNNPSFSFEPEIAVSGNNVHVVWDEGNEIFYKRSIDRGGTFGATINLSNNAESSKNPVVAASGNNVHVVWDDDSPGNSDIMYRRSTDGGASFVEATKNLSSNSGISLFPKIAVSDNNVHVVWEGDTAGNFDILYRRSTNGGSTFPNIITNLSDNIGFSENPSIAASGNNVHVVWDDDTPGNFDILYKRSTDGGASFTEPIKNLSDNAGISARPAIAASGNNVHVVWDDSTPGNVEILYRRSTNGGSTFPNIITNLSNNAGTSQSPVIATSGTNLYVVWQDDIPGNVDILYRPSTDDGVMFDPTVTNLSTNTGNSFAPALTVS